MQTTCASQHNKQLNNVEQTLYYVLEDVLLHQSSQLRYRQDADDTPIRVTKQRHQPKTPCGTELP